MSADAARLGAKATIPLDREFRAITVEAWVWPFTTDGSHTTKLGSTFGSILAIEEVMEVGIAWDKLYFGAHLARDSVPLVPCKSRFQHNSFRTLVPAGQWTHVAAKFDGTKIMFFADGILMDTRVLDVAGFLETYSNTARNPSNLDVDIHPLQRGDLLPIQFQNVSGAEGPLKLSECSLTLTE
jgi:hypothetical protein